MKLLWRVFALVLGVLVVLDALAPLARASIQQHLSSVQQFGDVAPTRSSVIGPWRVVYSEPDLSTWFKQNPFAVELATILFEYSSHTDLSSPLLFLYERMASSSLRSEPYKIISIVVHTTPNGYSMFIFFTRTEVPPPFNKVDYYPITATFNLLGN